MLLETEIGKFETDIYGKFRYCKGYIFPHYLCEGGVSVAGPVLPMLCVQGSFYYYAKDSGDYKFSGNEMTVLQRGGDWKLFEGWEVTKVEIESQRFDVFPEKDDLYLSGELKTIHGVGNKVRIVPCT